MYQDLFKIPHEWHGIPVLGWGLLALAWGVFALIYLGLMLRWFGWSSELGTSASFCVLIGAAIVYLLPRIAEPDGIPIRGYGVMMLLAVTAGVTLAVHRARQINLADDVIYGLAMWMILPGIIGARLFFIIEYHGKFFGPNISLRESLVKMLSIQEGGLVVFGSLIGAMLGLAIFVYRHRLPLLPVLDLAAPSMAVGQAIGRIGCLLNGCCYGGPCDLPWSLTFPPHSPPYVEQVEHGKLWPVGIRWQPEIQLPAHIVVAEVQPNSPAEVAGIKPGMAIRQLQIVQPDGRLRVPSQLPGTDLRLDQASARWLLTQAKVGDRIVAKMDTGELSIPITVESRSLAIHPTQIYSAIDAFLLCGLLVAWTPFRRHHGEVIALTLILHAVSRFLLEIIRIDEDSVFGTSLSISQNISIIMFVVGMALFIWLRRTSPLKLRVQHLPV